MGAGIRFQVGGDVCFSFVVAQDGFGVGEGVDLPFVVVEDGFGVG